MLKYHSILLFMVIGFFTGAGDAQFTTYASDQIISAGMQIEPVDFPPLNTWSDLIPCSPDSVILSSAISSSMVENIRSSAILHDQAIDLLQTSATPPPPPKKTRPPRNTPTVIPSATPTPEAIPQVTDPRFLQTMIIFGIVTVVVILFGVYLNRDSLNPR